MLDLRDPTLGVTPLVEDELPDRVKLDRYRQLKRLAWQQPETRELSVQEALALYERNWRHVDQQSLEPQERALLTVWSKRSAEGGLLFERAHHRRIATVLDTLDAALQAEATCWFGGGTAIALRFGE